MKTILVDAVNTFVDNSGEIFREMHDLLDTFEESKIILTNANDDQIRQFGLDKMPYQVFTLGHNPEKTDPSYFQIFLQKFNLSSADVVYFEHNIDAVKSAQSLGIKSFYFDKDRRDISKLKNFLERNLYFY